MLASDDGTASVLDASSGALLHHLEGLHDFEVRACCVSADGTRLLLGSRDKTASVVARPEQCPRPALCSARS